jgi:hypothetical protein
MTLTTTQDPKSLGIVWIYEFKDDEALLQFCLALSDRLIGRPVRHTAPFRRMHSNQPPEVALQDEPKAYETLKRLEQENAVVVEERPILPLAKLATREETEMMLEQFTEQLPEIQKFLDEFKRRRNPNGGCTTEQPNAT